MTLTTRTSALDAHRQGWLTDRQFAMTVLRITTLTPAVAQSTQEWAERTLTTDERRVALAHPSTEATTTITTPLGETFTHSAWVQGDTDAYDVEVGPRLTFRRVLAGQVKVGDHLMDAFGRPSIEVVKVRRNKRTVSMTLGNGNEGHQSFSLIEVLNVFVSSEPVNA